MDVHVRVALDGDGPVVIKSGTGPAADRLRRERERLERAAHPGVVALAPGPGLAAPPGDQPASTGSAAPPDPVAPPGDRSPGPGDGIPGGDRSVPDGQRDRGVSADDRDEVRTRYAGEPVSRWTGPPAAVAGVGAAVASTLADLHDMGIVHGRLDATHVLIGDDGRPRLCGLAEPGDATPADDVAALGTLLGDLLARAPDTRRGPRRWARAPAGAQRALGQVVEHATDPAPTRRPGARALADAILAAVPAASLPRHHGLPGRPGRPGGPGHGTATSPVDQGAPARDTLDRIWSYADQRSDDERWAAAFGSGPLDLPLAASGEAPLPVADLDTPGWSATAPTREDDRWRGGVGHGRDPGPGGGGDDFTREHRAAAGRMLMAPRTAPARDRVDPPAWRRRLVLAAGLAATGLAVAGAMALGSEGGAGASRPRPTRADLAGGRCSDAAAPAADVNGDGCPEALAIDGSIVDAGVARWSLGEPGDLVTLGDWDCDGEASAALLRPATGDVFVFSAWAESDEPMTVTATRRVDGGVAIRAVPDEQGCDRLMVDLAGGATAVEVVP